MTVFCAKRSVSFSALVREGSSYVRWEQIQRFTVRQCIEGETHGKLSSKWDVSIKSPATGIRKLFGSGDRNIVSDRRKGGHQGNKSS